MKTVLDIGSGIRPQQYYQDSITICVEPCYEYVEKLATMPGIVAIHAAWAEVPFLFLPKSVDLITILDVIEHLPKEEGKRLLEQTLPIARIGVNVYTPVGFVEQSPGEAGLDAWGLHGGEWQRHQSGWLPEDFPEWETNIDNFYDVPMLMAYWRVR